jgi:hypothetical protein
MFDTTRMDELAAERDKVNRSINRLDYTEAAEIRKALVDGRLPMSEQIRITEKYDAKRAALQAKVDAANAECTPLWEAYKMARGF